MNKSPNAGFSRTRILLIARIALLLAVALASPLYAQQRVETAGGTVEGSEDASSGVRSFKGIPYAAPPVGDLRWKPPQPAAPWKGARDAKSFGPRAMQLPIFGDMAFRSAGMSEDCLYLNVWTPAKSGASSANGLPVLVYFFGGGFIAGDGSEGRYDGESMARKGIVSVTVTFRLGVFGFFSHPELTKESPRHASGNYGLLDQNAALVWVRQNIAAFGGDPAHITIAGESAGSLSVSAQMASPLSRDLIAGAIGESGALVGPPKAVITLAEAEKRGVEFAARLGLGPTPSLADLRAVPAEKLLAATAGKAFEVEVPVDGYFLTKKPVDVYRAGEQARVPLLAGCNSEEKGYGALSPNWQPTAANYKQLLRKLYPKNAAEVLALYPASSDTEAMASATDLASDRFIRYGTWRWAALAAKTGGRPTYFYLFSHPRPPMRSEMGSAVAGFAGGIIKGLASKAPLPPPRGAVHSAEIEYALGNLDRNKVYAWTPEDRQVSEAMQEYFANFIKTGNPNGPGLAPWPDFASDGHMAIDVDSRAQPNEALRARYDFLDRFYLSK